MRKGGVGKGGGEGGRWRSSDAPPKRDTTGQSQIPSADQKATGGFAPGGVSAVLRRRDCSRA